MNWDLRQARISLLLFLVVFSAGLVKTFLTRPLYPDPSAYREAWPPPGCLVDATATKKRALEVFPRGTRIGTAVKMMGLEVAPVGSGFCLPRAGVLFKGKGGWQVRSMTQKERWVWRIPMDIHQCGCVDLARIRGIGNSLGERIHRFVEGKKCLGSLSDLLAVPGIGPARLEMLKEELALD